MSARKPRVYKKKATAARKKNYSRKRIVVKGRGDYWTSKDEGTKILGNPGSFKAYGGYYGRKLGELAGNAIATLTGFGDYVHAPWAKGIKRNSLAMGLSPPEIKNSSMKNVIIRHREYLGDVYTGAAGVFKNTAYSINPGIVETFPWLSQVAMAFEQYKLRGMIFEFKSASADALNSTNTALGTVIMATEYDSTRPDFASKQQMENHQYAMSARQSCSMVHPIECARSENVLSELYVRNGKGSDDDLRFTDFGKFQIATVGQQGSTVNIGELWCSYEIEFLKPRFGAPTGSGSVLTAHISTANGITNAEPFGSFPTETGNIGIVAGGNELIFPDWLNSGQFLVFHRVEGDSTAVNLSMPTLVGCETVDIWDGGGSSWVGTDGVTTTSAYIAYVIKITAAEASVTYPAMTWPANAIYMDCVVTSYNPLATVQVKEVKEEKEEKEIKEDLPKTIDRLLESGKTLADIQRMITDRAFEAMKNEAVKEFKDSKSLTKK